MTKAQQQKAAMSWIKVPLIMVRRDMVESSIDGITK